MSLWEICNRKKQKNIAMRDHLLYLCNTWLVHKIMPLWKALVQCSTANCCWLYIGQMNDNAELTLTASSDRKWSFCSHLWKFTLTCINFALCSHAMAACEITQQTMGIVKDFLHDELKSCQECACIQRWK